MRLSRSLRLIILIEIFIPIFLLIIGIYNGLMQTIYRAGVIHRSSVMDLGYYQGLTLHGVINAIVLTTFFAVAFGHATITFLLKIEPRVGPSLISLILMLTGTILATWAMISGKASVLYNFYFPLRAHPFFYFGIVLLVVGSWIPLFNWLSIYKKWKKKHPGEKIPLGVLGTLVNFIIWFVCTLSVAYEIIVLLLPWSMGLVPTVNVPLARTLFWFFGHSLVYFCLLPAYIMYYTMMPKLAGGKLYSDLAGSIVFIIFLVLSIPVGVHHQFSDSSIGQSSKFTQTLLTFGVALPSFITAFTLAASLEYAGKRNGSKGLFGWIGKLPYLDPNRYLFAYMICGLILFIFGGLTGLVNASYSLNAVIHNTAWLPGHFHMTVAGPVFLGIIGMSLYLISTLRGRSVFLPTLNVIIPYLWLIGVLIFSSGLMWGGLMGEPRRTNLGLIYLNPQSSLYHSQWVPSTLLALAGGILMFITALLYFIVFFGTFFRKKVQEPQLTFVESECYRDEKMVPLLNGFRPWIILMVIVIILAYLPALLDVLRYSGPGALPHLPGSPLPGILLS